MSGLLGKTGPGAGEEANNDYKKLVETTIRDDTEFLYKGGTPSNPDWLIYSVRDNTALFYPNNGN